MYESHFGITAPPFQLSPDPSFYFDSKGHHAALEALREGLADPRGHIVVSGEVGAGKTLLVSTLLAELDTSKIAVARLASTQLGADDLLRAIQNAFGAERRKVEREGVSDLVAAIDAFLARSWREGHRAVLFIDEAQNLSVDALERLAALGRPGPELPEPAFTLCLVGQPELRSMLAAPEAAALRARVVIQCHLSPLGPFETGAYIGHRLDRVGWQGRPSFDTGAIDRVHRWTGGVPRRINQLCNRLMLAAYLNEQDRIDRVLVDSTAEELRAEIGESALTPVLPARLGDLSAQPPRPQPAAADAPAQPRGGADEPPAEAPAWYWGPLEQPDGAATSAPAPLAEVETPPADPVAADGSAPAADPEAPAPGEAELSLPAVSLNLLPIDDLLPTATIADSPPPPASEAPTEFPSFAPWPDLPEVKVVEPDADNPEDAHVASLLRQLLPGAAERVGLGGSPAPAPKADPVLHLAPLEQPQTLETIHLQVGARTQPASQGLRPLQVQPQPPAQRQPFVRSEPPPLLRDAVEPAGPGLLLCVVGGLQDHVQAAVLMRALAARRELPPARLVRAFAGDALQRSEAMFRPVDIERAIALGVPAGGTAADRATELMARIEKLASELRPSGMIVFDGGAAALPAGVVASRRGTPLLRVGAGQRPAGDALPTELSRKLSDHVADMLYTADAAASDQLRRDGFEASRISMVGNLRADAIRLAVRSVAATQPRGELAAAVDQVAPDQGDFGLVYVEQRTNVQDRRTLSDLVTLLAEVSRDIPLVWTVQAATHEQLLHLRLDAVIDRARIVCLALQPYPAFALALAESTLVLTDSWTVQEEAAALEVPCLAVGTTPPNPVTVAHGGTTHIGMNRMFATRVLWGFKFGGGRKSNLPRLWDGRAAERIAGHLVGYLARGDRPSAPRR